MNLKFKVGDIIVYRGDSFIGEINKEQRVIRISNGRVFTEFINFKGFNEFGERSRYYEECVNIRSDVFVYENGIPVIWEDGV